MNLLQPSSPADRPMLCLVPRPDLFDIAKTVQCVASNVFVEFYPQHSNVLWITTAPLRAIYMLREMQENDTVGYALDMVAVVGHFIPYGNRLAIAADILNLVYRYYSARAAGANDDSDVPITSHTEALEILDLSEEDANDKGKCKEKRDLLLKTWEPKVEAARKKKLSGLVESLAANVKKIKAAYVFLTGEDSA